MVGATTTHEGHGWRNRPAFVPDSPGEMGAPWQPGTSKNRGTRLSSGGCMTPARRAVAGSLVLAGVGVAWAAGAAGPDLPAEPMLRAAVLPPPPLPGIFLPPAPL